MIPLVYKGILLKNAMGFNRTFMELKQPGGFEGVGEPGFNRTFMELKHWTTNAEKAKHVGFNRTFMELKHGSRASSFFSDMF